LLKNRLLSPPVDRYSLPSCAHLIGQQYEMISNPSWLVPHLDLRPGLQGQAAEIGHRAEIHRYPADYDGSSYQGACRQVSSHLAVS
jgi:hypothetical protein